MTKMRTIGRRTLLGAAVVTAGVASGVGAYLVTDQELINKAYADGAAAGRKAVLDQMKQVNGVSLDAAVVVARNTQQATKYVAQPVGVMLSQIGDNTLSSVISAVGFAQNLAFLDGGVADLLGHLKSLLTSWQNNLSQLAVPLKNIPESDWEAAFEFLNGVSDYIAEHAGDAAAAE